MDKDSTGRPSGNDHNEYDDGDDLEDFERGFARISPLQEDDEEDQLEYEELPTYCFQHAKQTLEQKGTFIGSTYIDFDGMQHREILSEDSL